MNKNACQLMEDYGKNALGATLAGLPIESMPSDGVPEGETVSGSASIIMTEDSNSNVKGYLIGGSNIGGIPIEMPSGDLTNNKVYELVYNSTKNAFVLTAAS